MEQRDLLDRLTASLAAYEDVVVAIAFGSAVKGGLGPDSDVDVAVLTDPALAPERAGALIADLGAASGRPVDLVDLRTAGVLITREALTHGRRLTCRDRGALAAILSRMRAVSKLSTEAYAFKGQLADVPRLQRTLVRIQRAPG